MNVLKALVQSIVWFSVTYGVILYFFGITTVTSSERNGNPVVSQVYINGDLKGDTPLSLRLGPGLFSITVVPPKEYRAGHSRQGFFTMGIGADFHEPVYKKDYGVAMFAPEGKRASFEILNGLTNEPIAACDGETCKIPLPGPGEYLAKMRTCNNHECGYGSRYFTLSDEENGETTTITWR